MKIDKEEYNKYLRSELWNLKRTQRLTLDHHTCCVCGREATEVHHLTYEHFKSEPMDDLVSLCRDCHEEAEKLSKPENKKWITEDVTSSGNFMAVMRMDAQRIAPEVYGYLLKVRGSDFQSILELRSPSAPNKRDPWHVLEKAVIALCRKRYEVYTEDRKDVAMRMITSHTMVQVCLGAIIHEDRNYVQADLKDGVEGMKESCKTWKEAYKQLGITDGVGSHIRKDNGETSGPTLRESVFYYCGLDAIAGIKPDKRFDCCLLPEDFDFLNALADYVTKTSGIEFSNVGGKEESA